MNIIKTGKIYNIEKNSIIPVYYQLARLLERQIYEGELCPGEAIPPENEIALKYGISRMTVRRAISELVSAGLLYTQKGKGTYVSKPKLDDVVFELNDFHSEIENRGMKPSTRLLSVKIVRADEHLSKKLEIPLGTSCLFIKMLLCADEEPLVYESKYILYSKQKPILEVELKDPSLSNLAAIHSEYLPTICKKVLHASIAREEESKALNIPQNTPVFVVEQTLFNSEKKPIGWSTSVYRGDRYKLTSYTGWPMEDL